MVLTSPVWERLRISGPVFFFPVEIWNPRMFAFVCPDYSMMQWLNWLFWCCLDTEHDFQYSNFPFICVTRAHMFSSSAASSSWLADCQHSLEQQAPTCKCTLAEKWLGELHMCIIAHVVFKQMCGYTSVTSIWTNCNCLNTYTVKEEDLKPFFKS